MAHQQRSIIKEWDGIAEEMNRQRHSLLLFDYDGTLAPISNRPSQAHLSTSVRKGLANLSRLTNCTVGVVSGRSLPEIRRLVNLPGIVYIGNHGLEIESDGWSFAHPSAKAKKSTLQKLATRLSRAIRGFKGAFVENKGLTLSLHYRLVNSRKRKVLLSLLRSELSKAAANHRLLVREGRKVFEILPIAHWNKGAAVMWLKNIVPAHSAIIYIGDDTTDEDVFRILHKKGVSIRVGAKNSSMADYYLSRQSKVGPFIKKLIDYYSGQENGHEQAAN